ncbi:hypothetical protein QUF76_02415 [Desulfobacterales bacterium HSG16]|nr:hypothetical protein [Desulfobacterales bacterium HSG16]
MPGFKKYRQSEVIADQYFERVIVYLESEEDCLIINDRWFFDQGEMIDFRSVDEGEGGGANEVIKRVKQDKDAGHIVFGIVDRDVLMREGCWDLWWEADDQKFNQARPFGESIRILKRWELENYLLVPDILEEVMADRDGRTKQFPDAVNFFLNDLAEEIKVLSAASILFNENGRNFGTKLDRIPDFEILKEKTEKFVREKLDDGEIEKLNVYVEKIESFSENNDSPSIVRWERINRLLDGKRVLRRLNLAFRPRKGDDLRFTLASRLNNRVDREIRDYINEFKNAKRF